MTGLERLAQSACHYLCECVCVCVCECVCVYLADAGCNTRVIIRAPLHAAVTAQTGRVVHITDSTPADR